jgi:hypothetical protein
MNKICQPISTCIAETCEDCTLKENVSCHFRMRDYLLFMLSVIPGFGLGVFGINRCAPAGLLPWVGLWILFFGVIEIRVLCTHCPHYAEDASFLRCWANRGTPKPWRFRPGPLTRGEKLVMLGGFALVWGYPLVFLVLGADWVLLLGYLVASVGFFAVLRTCFCARCMNFGCPFNAVHEDSREAFLRRNPVVAAGWPDSDSN